MDLFLKNFIKKTKSQEGYFLLELLLAMFILAMATIGISMLFLYAENAGMYAILQNRAVQIMRQEAELVLSTPYSEVDAKLKKTLPLLPQPGKPNVYTIDIRRTVFVFPNKDNSQEPAFKIINIQGIWTFRGRKQTNYIQTVSVP